MSFAFMLARKKIDQLLCRWRFVTYACPCVNEALRQVAGHSGWCRRHVKHHVLRSRSLEMAPVDRQWDIHCNWPYWRYLASFPREREIYWSKIAIFSYPLLLWGKRLRTFLLFFSQLGRINDPSGGVNRFGELTAKLKRVTDRQTGDGKAISIAER